MMNFLGKKLLTILSLLFVMVVVSCVPTVAQKKAQCGTGQAFSNVTRSCYTITSGRLAPVPTLNSDSIQQETSKLVTLTFTDANNDPALSCRVNGATAEIETFSPVLFDGRLFAAVDALHTAASNLSTQLTAATVAEAPAVAAAITQITSYRTLLKNSFVQQTVQSNLINFRVAVEGIISLSAAAYNANLYSGVMSAYTLAASRLADLVPLTDFMTNQCACSAGVCSTYVVTKIRKHGTAGFNYSITDIDGESTLKNVVITVQPMSLASTPAYAPAAQGPAAMISMNESATSTAVASSVFQLPNLVGDYNLSVTAPTYHVSAAPTKGSVVCNLLGACQYTPNNGNQTFCPVTNSTWYVSVIPTATASGQYYYNTITNLCYKSNAAGAGSWAAVSDAATANVIAGPITYTANSIGSAGNNIRVNYYDLRANNLYVDGKSSPSENFGLVNGSTREGYVRVINNTINVFVNPIITTVDDVVALITEDSKASKLVTVAGAGATAIGTPLPTNAVLANGLDEFDKFSYYVNNGHANSAAVDVVVHITPVDDPAVEVVPGVVSTNPTVLKEEVGFIMDITSTFTDVDSVPTACELHYTDLNIASGNFSAAICSCVAGICSIAVTPNNDVYGTFSFVYNIDSGAGGNWSGPITRSITIAPVNDFPFVTTTDLTLSTNGVAAATISRAENPLGGFSAPVILVHAPPEPTNIAKISGILTAITMSESTYTAEQTATLKLTTINMGGGVREAAQTIPSLSYVTVASSNTNLVAPTVTGDATSGYLVNFAPVTGQSGTATITITLKDNGGVSDVGVDTSVQTLVLTVDPQNDYPYFVPTDSAYACTFNLRTNAAAYCSVDVAGVLTKTNCVGIVSPVGTVTPSTFSPITASTTAPGYTLNTPTTNVMYWDSAHSKCYRSTGTTNTSWVEQTPALVETNEGGDAQIDFTFDEDKTNSTDENPQNLTIVSITSDNPSVLTVSSTNVTAYYDVNDNGVEDSGEKREINNTETLEPATPINLDSKTHKLYLKLKTFGGIAGNANITVTLVDDGVSGSPAAADPKTISKNFSLVVHQIASLHGGWANISGVGIKTNKYGEPVNVADRQCNYNKAADVNACADTNGTRQDCTGTSSPHSMIIPGTANVIFWDSANKKCYRAQEPVAPAVAVDRFSWIAMNTSCPVTRDTAGSNWIRVVTAIAPVVDPPTPTTQGQFYYDPSLKKCYISISTDAAVLADNWGEYTPTKVNLEWNSFILTGTGGDANVRVGGWNVYRREKGGDYNFINGHLRVADSTAKMTIPNSLARSFTDNTAIAGKIYFYTVRAVDDSSRNVATYTPEIYSEVRVLAPPDNYSFVHRWTVNQEICNKMNMTTTTTNKVDPTHNYRCPYIGPGGAAGGYYDYGQDLLVDISEMGCPYTDAATAPDCGINGCIGIGDPNTLPDINAIPGLNAPGQSVFYDRFTGICYRNSAVSTSSGRAWLRYTGSADLPSANSALNPPLTNITEEEAAATCAARPQIQLYQTPTSAILPEKKDYMAYSTPPAAVAASDSQIATLELGAALDVQSGCNGSNAGGLVGFTDANIPSSSYMYSLPGTASSGIKSIITGSVPLVGNFAATESCTSRYGVQDVYGNVAEWVRDYMTCYDGAYPAGGPDTFYPYTCAASNTTDMGNYNFGTIAFSGTPGALGTYGFDDVTGPFYDKNPSILSVTGPDETDDYMTEWNFTERLYNAGKFSFPLGLPVHTDIAARINFTAIPTLLDIGSGITNEKLHGDGIIANGLKVVNPDNLPLSPESGIGYFAVGGSYLSLARSGRFTMELIERGQLDRKDVGFRCVVPVINGIYQIDAKHHYSY